MKLLKESCNSAPIGGSFTCSIAEIEDFFAAQSLRADTHNEA